MTVTSPVQLLAVVRRTDAEPRPSSSRRPPVGSGLSLQPARLLAEHAEYLATLGCNQQAKRLRERGAEEHLAAFADLVDWMGRPTAVRVAEARRFGSWSFLTWCFVTGRLRPDVELLVMKQKGVDTAATGSVMAGAQIVRLSGSICVCRTISGDAPGRIADIP